MNLNVADPIKSAESEGKNCRLMDSFSRSLKLAFEMCNAGRVQEAEALCLVLLPIQPQDAQLHFLMGMVLHKMDKNEEAVGYLSLAAQYQPQSARIFSGLGCVYKCLKDYTRAATAFKRARQLEPKSGAIDYNLGNTCYKLGQVAQAEALFRSAVEKDPRDSASWNNLGKCLKELNRLDESIETYDRALEIAPEHALARYGRAISLLTAGRLPQGFKDYEGRFHLVTPRHFPQPKWTGDPAPGQTLLLYAEQGFGDAIQMVRFLPAVRERLGHVILECRPELQTLFQYSKCADIVVPYGAEIPRFDCRLSLISLPHILGIDLANLPNRTPYLQAPRCAGLPPAPPGRLKVGLAWAGNPDHHQDAARSIRLKQLAPILNLPGISFYSLQKPIPAVDRPCLQTLPAAFYLNLNLANFLQTASIISQMDLVITVDTAIAHLAGALGKPVWILLQHSPDWRWLLDRSDSPWYPTARLFRQEERNEWAAPILQVADALPHYLDPGVPSLHRETIRA